MPVLLIAIAQIVASTSRVPSDSLGSPSRIAAAGWQAVMDGSLFVLTAQTLRAVLLGVLLGGVIGLTCGILLGLSRSLDRLMMVTLESIRPIPSAALIPVVLLIFGFGYRMEVVLIAVGAVFPVLIYARSAVAGTEPRLLEVSRVLGLNLPARIWKIVLPAALPRIFVGFRLAAGLALVIAVTVEVSVNPQGLGSAIMIAEQTLQPALMYALLLWTALVGWSLNASLLWLQRRMFARAGIERQP